MAHPRPTRSIPSLRDLVAPPLLALFVIIAGSDRAQGQEPVEPILRGEVVRDSQAVSGSTVTLHRVAPQSAGEVDSTRTGTEGEFQFRLPTVPGAEAESGDVYFASVRHDGVLYFGQAVNQTAQLDSLYRIAVYDTVSAPPEGREFSIIARNLILEEAEDGWTVVDLFRIQNSGRRTVVARDGGIVWSHPLPPSATDFEPGESDLAPDAVAFRDGQIRVSSPTPPGERSYLMRYHVPELPFQLPVADSTQRMEMLVREPAPPVTVSGLQQLEPVQLEPESNYRRFAGADLAGQVIEISEGEEGGSGQVAWFAVILGLVLAGAAVYGMKRAPGAKAAAEKTRSQLLLEIAELDAAFQDRDDLSSRARKQYETERKRMKEKIRKLEEEV